MKIILPRKEVSTEAGAVQGADPVFQQLRRKLNDVGINLAPDLGDLLQNVQPVLAGG